MFRAALQTASTRGVLRSLTEARAGTQTQFTASRMKVYNTLSRRAFITFRSSNPKPSRSFIFSSRSSPQTNLQRLRSSFRSFHSSRPRRNGIPNPVLEPEPQTLGARMKKLSREYGWSAVGVYFTLSALDFPFCYLLVKTLGTDRIGK